ncbi:MAG TPA: single-stranded-DNA-specific exonuclease RecJ [Luteibaculaceae bacterium]|nr:single-stranded-DNA-specific exonuclease RecJ [Luteibaculaceae bacterium]
MNKLRWSYAPIPNSESVKSLANALSIDLTLAALLVQRGITDFDQAKAYFQPSLDQLHDPFLMRDMDRAVERVNRALKNQEKILVYGDYDVDGTTSVAAMFQFLRAFTDQIDYYIPDRYTEGYGLSQQGIEFAKNEGYQLIITLDCGIKEVKNVALARDKGLDIIVCDHHTPGSELPQAFAILNAKRTDCEYPYKELCGCGVGFKLMQALCLRNGWDPELAFAFLDLVAVSIAADIVPMTGENRALCFMGLKRMQQGQMRPGLSALLKSNELSQITVNTLVFTIAPRINAAGRITSGKQAVALLLSDTIETANLESVHINQNNETRRELDKTITLEALAQLESRDNAKTAKSTVVYHDGWHKGVVGIVASRLTEHYYRPTIVLTKSGDHLAGSARSVHGFDVYQAIEACSEHLIQFGGHKYAAGLSLKPEKLVDFQHAFEQAVGAAITPEQLEPELRIDLPIELPAIDQKFVRILNRMEPFGPENPIPTFFATELQETGWARIVGEKHLKCRLFDPRYPDYAFDAIGFNLAHHLPHIGAGKTFAAAFTIGTNTWNGATSIQLELKDIKPAGQV